MDNKDHTTNADTVSPATTILVVDDEPGITKTVERRLTSWGYRVKPEAWASKFFF